MELVSVIVPIYNVENYIRRCLESLVHQTYQNIEIILVNDGSKDSSAKIAEEYANMYSNIVLIHQENQGLSGARNTGLANAKGEYILYVDSDDYVSLSTVENMVSLMANADMVEPKNIQVDECGRESDYGYHSPIDIQNYDLQNNMQMRLRAAMFVRGNMYRKSIIEGLEFPVGLVHEDIYYSSILFQKISRIHYAENAVYYYFIRSDSIMNKPNDKMFDMFEVMKRLYAYFNEHNYSLSFLEKVYVRNFVIAVLFKKAKNIDEKYYEKRTQICQEALSFLESNLKGYRTNPYITWKEKLAVKALWIPMIRNRIWR